MKIRLETDRMLMREFQEDDVATFHVLGSNPDIIRYTCDPGGGFRDLEHARELDEIIALVMPANSASVRVLEKIGMQAAGTMEYDGEQTLRYVACR